MTEKRILFPTDFSSISEAAFKLATTIARSLDAQLLILHVEEPATAYQGASWSGDPLAPTKDELAAQLRNIRPDDPDIRYEHRMIMDDPAAGIIRVAAEENVEMIVIATHGRGGLSRFLMGSVAERVVREATCPVLTLKASLAAVV